MPGPRFDPRWTAPKRFDEDRAAGFSGSRWQRIRRIWLMRNPSCNRCGLAAEEVHHVVQRKDAPHRWDDWGNLESLCHRCHMAHHHAP